MPHKDVSSSAALNTSVDLLREGIGPAVSNAFAVAPLWVPGVGCIGLFTIADIPYARPPSKAGRRAGGGPRRRKHGTPHDSGRAKSGSSHRQQQGGGGGGGKTAREPAKGGRGGGGEYSHARHVVGAGVVELARRVGVALGTAVFRLRKKSLVTSIRAEGSGCSIFGGDNNIRNGNKNRLRLASSLSPSSSPPREEGLRQGNRRREVPMARRRR